MTRDGQPTEQMPGASCAHSRLRGAEALFLLGAPRSGTTLLAKVLNAHPRILLTHESALFLHLHKAVCETRAETATGSLLGKEYFSPWGEHLLRQAPSLAESFYERIAESEGKEQLRFWGDKHPHHDECLLMLESLYPGARYVYLVRDPRDVACSIAAMNEWSLSRALMEWRIIASNYESFAPLNDIRRSLTVRYEDLVANYDLTAERILNWLGLESAPAVREFLDKYRAIDVHQIGSDNPQAVGRWRREFKSDDGALANRIAGDYLQKYGYAREHDIPVAISAQISQSGCGGPVKHVAAELTQDSLPTANQANESELASVRQQLEDLMQDRLAVERELQAAASALRQIEGSRGFRGLQKLYAARLLLVPRGSIREDAARLAWRIARKSSHTLFGVANRGGGLLRRAAGGAIRTVDGVSQQYLPAGVRRAARELLGERLVSRLRSVDRPPISTLPAPILRRTKRDKSPMSELPIHPAFDAAAGDRLLNENLAKSERKTDVICLSIIAWNFRYQRPQQMASQFAAHGHRVFYVNPVEFLSPNGGQLFDVREVKPNLYEVRLAGQKVDIYSQAIEGAPCQRFLEALAALRREHCIEEAIILTLIASWTNVALELRQRWGWRLIYDCMDDWETFPGIGKPVLEAEERLAEDSDLLIVTARRLEEKWQNRGKRPLLVRNGADFDFFAERCRPNGLLPDCGGPIVGYYGAIADWFDLDLMEYTARQRPNYTFVLLGGVFGVDVSRLRSLPNVRLLGQQPYSTMPEYLYHFDACVIPFKINAVTEATDPVKVYEYFSAGKPVVATPMPELRIYQEHLWLAGEKDEFVQAVDAAVAERDPDRARQRQNLAQANSWSARYRTLAGELAASAPKASIVVVTYNNLPLTRACVESVFRSTSAGDFELIVVDNASADGTPDYLRRLEERFINVQVILNDRNLGFAKANNQGLKLARGEHLVLLNNDTLVATGWLERLLRHLRRRDIGLVGPVTNAVGNEAKIDVSYRTWGEMEDFAEDRNWSHDGQFADIPMLAMFCVAMRRETFEVVGPLDEQFGIGMFEDDDYTQRVRAKGWRVVCALDTFIHHFGQASFGKLIRTGEYNTIFEENRRRYERKWRTEWVAHRHGELKASA